MSRPVRVRFAPSPTGPLHIGGVRTALFNYLFAKKNNGVFYLRIEDTDQNRFVPGAEQYIFEALEWLGIAPSETVNKNEKFGPYRQSERKHLYKQYADQLVNSGWAYYAFDTAEKLDFLRTMAEAAGNKFIYNWSNRDNLDNSLNKSEIGELGEKRKTPEERIAAGEDFVIRFKTPVNKNNEPLLLKDIIRGVIKFDIELLDDKVLFKSDGMPTYHLANIVDDHLMETSHVIRGEEWLPSLPLHHLLYKAFGWEAPEFAHLPLILKPIGNGKLSKRDGDKMGFPVFPLEWKTDEGVSSGYRETGYFPEAVINFLALLGWNDGTDQELFSLDELVEKFDLNRVHKAGAKFDPEKNKWFNHQYLVNRIGLYELTSMFIPIIEKHVNYKIIHDKEPIERIEEKDDETQKVIKSLNNSDYCDCNFSNINFGYVMNVITKIKEKANFVSDFWEHSDFLFVSPNNYDEKVALKVMTDENKINLKNFINLIERTNFSTTAYIHSGINEWLSDNNISFGKIAQPLRLSLAGSLKGPDIYEIIKLLGKEETIKRIEKAITTL